MIQTYIYGKTEVPIEATNMKRKLNNEIIRKVYLGNYEEIKGLIEEVASLKDSDGRNILFHAILSNNLEFVSAFVDKGVDINCHDKLGWTPLHYAVQIYSLEISKFLIEKGANVDSVDNHGNSVLWRAVFESKGRGEIINLLLNNGATKNLKNNYDVSPLELANTISNYEISVFFN